jgi:hypothetical protein
LRGKRNNAGENQQFGIWRTELPDGEEVEALDTGAPQPIVLFIAKWTSP